MTKDQAVTLVVSWLDELEHLDRRSAEALPPCRYVVTPNLDHAVLLLNDKALRQAYSEAALVLADGMPLVWASQLFQRPLPERVTGSDLAPEVLGAAREGTKVFFLGASEASSKKAVENVALQFPGIEVVGRLSPPFGFENSPEWSQKIAEQIAESKAQLVVVGLGAPKQEIWVHKHQHAMRGTVVLCVGATIDFLAGSVKRAPAWAQKSGVEWIHRLLSDPRRLARRYGKDALYVPRLLFRDWSFSRRGS